MNNPLKLRIYQLQASHQNLSKLAINTPVWVQGSHDKRTRFVITACSLTTILPFKTMTLHYIWEFPKIGDPNIVP